MTEQKQRMRRIHQRRTGILNCDATMAILLLLTASVAAFAPQSLPFRQRHSMLPPLEAAKKITWDALYKSIVAYKSEFGNLDIPPAFKVPEDDSWPEAAQTIPLGKVWQKIDKYATTPKRKEQIEKLSAASTTAATSETKEKAPAKKTKKVQWQTVYEGLKAYQAVEGPNTFPPENYETEDLKLGMYVERVRKTVIPKNAKAATAFFQLGLTKDGPLVDLFAREQNEEEKSSQLETVYAPPQAKAVQDEDDEAEEAPLNIHDIRFQNVYTALKVYKDLYGDLMIPQPFTVPKKEPWPEETWNMRLGARVNAIRSQGTFINNNPERRKLLEDLGFVWSSAPNTKARPPVPPLPSYLDFDMDDDDNEEIEEEALNWNFDDAHMPESSNANSWMEGTLREDLDEATDQEYAPRQNLAEFMEEASKRALEYGVIEGFHESRRVKKGGIPKNIPWFNDDFSEDFVFEDVVEALTLYSQLYDGDWSNLTRTDSDFVVPAPEEPTGFLGDDDDIFGTFQESPATTSDALYPDAMIAAELAQVTLEGKTSTVDNGGWPEHLADMKLANVVRRIRDGSLEVRHLPERKAALDAINFDWGPDEYFLDVPFEKAMCAMYAYYLIRGDMYVPHDFAIPDEEPWPEALFGYELGPVVTRLRQLQNYIEAFHTDKLYVLRMVDFVWFAMTDALPITEIIKPPTIVEHTVYSGVDDHVFHLRRLGYQSMADDFEAKYGAGLLCRVNETLSDINANNETWTVDEKIKAVETLSSHRKELMDCTDLTIKEFEELIYDLDDRMREFTEDEDVADAFTSVDLSPPIEEDVWDKLVLAHDMGWVLIEDENQREKTDDELMYLDEEEEDHEHDHIHDHDLDDKTNSEEAVGDNVGSLPEEEFDENDDADSEDDAEYEEEYAEYDEVYEEDEAAIVEAQSDVSL